MSKKEIIVFKDGLADSSKKLYLKNLEKLNDSEPIKNLNFLKNPEVVLSKLGHFKPNTQRSYLISVCAILGGDKNKKMLKTYTDLLVNLNTEIRKNPVVNSPKMTWDDVETKWQILKTKFDSIKVLTERNWNSYLEFMVLSLYVLVPPRRNEYQTMYIVKTWNEETPFDRNYYCVSSNRFIFNIFKTVKKDGQLILDVPEELQKVLMQSIKLRGLKKLDTENALLTNSDGSSFKHLNSITRILNNIFKPIKIGSSQLRHIYISSKYGKDIEERKKDSVAMSQSVATQAQVYTQNPNNI
jgi:integrase